MTNTLGDRRVQRHAPIREQVAAILRDAIVQMELRPGQVLIERELCEMTSASRPSVREALRQLESEGLVESRTGRGTVVAAPSRDQAEQLYQVRAELEGMAVELFTTRADDAQRAQLREAFDALERAVKSRPYGDVEAGVAAEMLAAKDRIYGIFIEGAGNEILSEMVGGLQRRVTQLRALTMTNPGRLQASLEEIRTIVEAVERKDAGAARRAATTHVEMAARTALSFVRGT
ncbi:DNA-binding GntR family transcriptional regulator [Microbacterium ginsengiterrae]|uniref:DNA-binding GntR family transcriptional regulator n=1 Tax=Microbacterium ginsengiterrae TaxID=546115 RepID=A0A7W9FCX7_9MICO|nr:GntR family transcriptional regulator [Microbacterium ginsengiterrae]MBB5742903.1 DNA-binding GntR family transcriptional regulator [Microbacterium ginsengiterrae]